MKKITKILLFVLVLMLIFQVCTIKSFATTITLEQIADKFNNSEYVKLATESGYNIKAVYDTTNLTIKFDEGEIVFTLDGTILSVIIPDGEEEAFGTAYIAVLVIDCIGELYGYEEGELEQTVNSEGSKNYTIENEGFSVNENTGEVKIDLSKKVPLLDFSNTYIEVSDIESSKQFIAGDGFTERSKGNIYFRKDGYDGEYTVLVAEKGQLTENTYKSILSILEVMFDKDKTLEYFKKNYSNISNGDKEFGGFKIEINPTNKTEWEELMLPSDSGYDFVRITIDKATVLNTINSGNNKDSIEGTTEPIPPEKDNSDSPEEEKELENILTPEQQAREAEKAVLREMEKEYKVEKNKIPNAGDTTMLVLKTITVVSIIALVVIIVCNKKMKK